MQIFKKILSFIIDIKFDLLILVLSFVLFIPSIFFSKPIRVGDGSEYYALSLSWKNTQKPYMTDESWDDYDHLVESGQISRLFFETDLKTFYPSLLTLGSEVDFPHFSFYSLCAAVITQTFELLGIGISIHNSFMLFHFILLACMFIIARRCFGWKGLVAAVILTFLSPMLWFINKVHTEFFTFCLTTSAIILFLKRQYLGSAFFLALASTQNISFAAISIFVIGVDILFRKNEKYSLFETVFITLTICISVLNPLYYFFRFGSLNPLLYIGGNVGANFRYFYIWLIDPDIGLLPNWPFGAFLLVFTLYSLRGIRINRRNFWYWATFVGCYVSVSLLAQSSTTNLNSAGSPGLARYATWYLALFFPALLIVIRKVTKSKSLIALIGVTLLILFGIIFSINYYSPSVDESVYTKPSPSSFWLQKHFPTLYNPPPEIFGERYSGIGELINLKNNVIVIGPDCHKMLFLRESTNIDTIVLGGTTCGLDIEKLSQTVLRNINNGYWTDIKTPTYLYLSDSQLEESKFHTNFGDWIETTSENNSIYSIIGDTNGWSIPETWGTWSDGNQAFLTIPCPPIGNNYSTPILFEMELVPVTMPTNSHITIHINIDDNLLWSGSLINDDIISIILPAEVCRSNNIVKIEILIDNPISPLLLGLSEDSRKLGIGLKRIRFVLVKNE